MPFPIPRNASRSVALSKSTRTRPRRPKGFTLVELMVVLVILALLTSVVTLSIRGYMIKSKQNIAKVQIGQLIQAIDSFYAEFDRYPTNEEGLHVLQAKTNEFPEGLIPRVPDDPWQRPYEYRCPGVNDPYEVICFGADHREGGENGDRDITSMQMTRGNRTK